MKRIIFLLAGITAAGSVWADHYVQGHTRKDGTYVQGHMASDPDTYRYNNRSSQTMGSTQRDEFSSRPRYNLSNPAYNPYLDQNRNGTYDYEESNHNRN